jgi:hypothetical protein
MTYGYEQYRAAFGLFGPKYKLWGYDSGVYSGGATEGWHYIGRFDVRDDPLPADCSVTVAQ